MIVSGLSLTSIEEETFPVIISFFWGGGHYIFIKYGLFRI